MISGVAFCPHPPAMVPQMAAGAAAELDALRAASVAAIRAVAAPGCQLLVLGAGPSSAAHSEQCRGTFAGFGLALEVGLGSASGDGELDLPLSLTVGAWLVSRAVGPGSGARGFSIGPDFDASPVQAELLAAVRGSSVRGESVALVVMGDGSARRSTSAPGYLDDRAALFDAAVTRALRQGDAAALATVDLELGAQLLAAGPPVWRVTGGLLAGATYDAELTYDAAPYGVGYFVATWHARA